MPTLSDWIAQLGAADPAQQYAAQRELQHRVHAAGAPGQDVQRTELAAALAAELNAVNESKDDKGKIKQSPRHAAAVRSRVARLLAGVAGESEVAALRKAADDFDVREMARWALDRMTTPGATAALIDLAENAVGPEFRIGALGALGRRAGEDVRLTLAKCALDANEEVRLAAAEELAALPSADSDQVFAAVLKFGQPSARAKLRLVKARLRLAEALVREGQAAAGKKVYEAIVAEGAEPPQLEAAQTALKALG